LRRHVFGIIRIIEEHAFTLELKEVFAKSLYLLPTFKLESDDHYYPEINDKLIPAIKGFFRDRLFQINIERGYRYDLVNAVLNAGIGFEDVYNFSQRLKVISDISKEEWWHKLVTVVERTFNIGKKASSSGNVNEALLAESEERILWDIYKKNEADIQRLTDDCKYRESSVRYCKAFSKPVHEFFDRVFVNVEDENIRNNRLSLMKKINELYSQKIADLSQIIIPDAKPS
jgi:glycyl-tRNA synthetase beta chain